MRAACYSRLAKRAQCSDGPRCTTKVTQVRSGTNIRRTQNRTQAYYILPRDIGLKHEDLCSYCGSCRFRCSTRRTHTEFAPAGNMPPSASEVIPNAHQAMGCAAVHVPENVTLAPEATTLSDKLQSASTQNPATLATQQAPTKVATKNEAQDCDIAVLQASQSRGGCCGVFTCTVQAV